MPPIVPTSRISNQILAVDGTAQLNVNVVARPSPAGCFRLDTGSEVAAVSTVTDDTGSWHLDLQQTANLSPAGSFYIVEEDIADRAAGPRQWKITVGPYAQTLAQALGLVP